MGSFQALQSTIYLLMQQNLSLMAREVANQRPIGVEVSGCPIRDYNQMFHFSGLLNGFASFTLPIEFTEEEDEWNDWGGNGMHQIVIYRLSSMPSGSSPIASSTLHFFQNSTKSLRLCVAGHKVWHPFTLAGKFSSRWGSLRSLSHLPLIKAADASATSFARDG